MEYSGHVKVVELLIQNGANVNVSGDDGFTSLHSSVSNGIISSILQIFIDRLNNGL